MISSGSFLESDANPLILRGAQWSFISGVLTANSPQLLLSFWYLLYVLIKNLN